MVASSPQSSTFFRTGEQYLQLQVGASCRALLPVACVQEALIISPQHFTLLPNQPAWVLGLFSYRDRVLWGLDLSQFLGLEPLDWGQPEHHLVVLRPEFSGLGLAVQQVRGVARMAAEQIQPLSETPAAHTHPQPDSLCDCCSGLALEREEPLWVLNPLAIAQKLSSISSPASSGSVPKSFPY